MGGFQEPPKVNLACWVDRKHVDETQRVLDYDHTDRMNFEDTCYQSG